MQHAEGRLMSVHWSASGLMEFVQHWLHNGHPDRVLLLLNVFYGLCCWGSFQWLYRVRQQ